MLVAVIFRCNYTGDFGKAVRTSLFHCLHRFPLFIVTFKKGRQRMLFFTGDYFSFVTTVWLRWNVAAWMWEEMCLCLKFFRLLSFLVWQSSHVSIPVLSFHGVFLWVPPCFCLVQPLLLVTDSQTLAGNAGNLKLHIASFTPEDVFPRKAPPVTAQSLLTKTTTKPSVTHWLKQFLLFIFWQQGVAKHHSTCRCESVMNHFTDNDKYMVVSSFRDVITWSLSESDLIC